MISRFLSYFLLSFCSLFSLFAENSITIKTLRGQEICSHVPEIVTLCDRIYREYPYLYNGENTEYTSYLESYAQSKDATICLVFDGNKAIGLAAGMPMQQSRDLYQQILLEHGYDLNTLFYLGEFGLNPEYRGQGIEEVMYQRIEAFAKERNQFTTICLWEIDHSSNSQKEPFGYIPQDAFWRNLGFIRHPDLNFLISWTNINDTVESPHLAVYWTKKL